MDVGILEKTPCPRCGEGHNLWACSYVKAISVSEVPMLGPSLRVEFVSLADFTKVQKEDGATPSPQGIDYPKLRAVKDDG